MSSSSSSSSSASAPASSSSALPPLSAEEAKKQKQLAFLAPHIDRASTLLKYGVRSLRYWRFVDDADRCEAELLRSRTILTEVLDKMAAAQTKEAKEKLQKDIKAAFDSIDQNADYMFYLYANALATPNERLVDDAFKDDVDWAQMDYAARVQKSVDARHRHAPGFDGAGGGVARGIGGHSE